MIYLNLIIITLLILLNNEECYIDFYRRMKFSGKFRRKKLGDFLYPLKFIMEDFEIRPVIGINQNE